MRSCRRGIATCVLLLILLAVDAKLQSARGPSANTRSASNKKQQIKLGGDATITTSSFNLAKNIVGAGVLALPSGVAFFSDSGLALLPAIAMMSMMGAASAYTFSSVGKCCADHNVLTFKEAWSKSVGPKSAWIISFASLSMCFFGTLVASIIIGDSFAALARTFQLPSVLTHRTNVILAMTTGVLLPLCSMRSMNALAPFSILGHIGVFYTAVVMLIRYLDGTYAPGGVFFEALAKSARPSFGLKNLPLVNVRAFVLLSMMSTSYICHYNAPKFYAELKDASMPRFNRVVFTAFFGSTVTYALMMATGFLTFGGAAQGFVLNNYASSDTLISLARLAIGVAIVAGYPLTFTALRTGVFDLTNVPPDQQVRLFQPLTLALLVVITVCALVLKDLGFVVSFSGAIFGAFVMFIVPAVMNIKGIHRKRQLLLTDQSKGRDRDRGRVSNADRAIYDQQRIELWLNYGIVGLGTTMGLLGATISILRQLNINKL